MNIKGVRANLWSQGMKVLLNPLRVERVNACPQTAMVEWNHP